MRNPFTIGLAPTGRSSMDETPLIVNQQSSAEVKIRLFRSLFRGREDVYPRRFESRKTGKSGYAPACSNEWVRGICEKPRIKCAECQHRRFLPVTDDVIRWHLSGEDEHRQPFVAGVYPLLLEEWCYFLAADFDKANWQDDAAAFLQVCQRLGLDAALERSRSGRGGHVWIFFEQAIPAALARRLGSHLLTETMEGRPDVGLDSYDRLFPSQDTLPQGGFGNLIALPLQKGPREHGHSVFLDEGFVPWTDQWAFLARIRKAGRSQVEHLVQEAERRGRIIGVRLPPQEDGDDEPWTMPPSRHRREQPLAGNLPSTLEIVLGNQIYVGKEALSPGLRNRLLRLAAFQNPEFYKAQSMRLSTYDKPRVIACAEDLAHHIGLPRGCLDEVRDTLRDLGIRPTVRDERHGGRPLDVTFQGELRREQQVAADAVLAHDTGVLAATTAFGKTVVGAWLIAKRGVSTLVLVHRHQLLDQWVERLSTFLGLPAKSIGRIGGGRNTPTGLLDVAVIQSLVRQGVVDDRVAGYGHLIVDECHHLSAHSFEQVARQARARFVLGLSATVARKDGHHPIIFMQCGPVRHRVNARVQAASRPFEHFALVQPTSFCPVRSPAADRRVEFQTLYQELVEDDARNHRICADVLEAVNAGRSPLVLTERNDHLDRLERELAQGVRHLVVLRAGMGKKQRQAVSDRRCPSHGAAPSRNTRAACTGCTTASAKSGSMTTRISTSRCWRACSTAAAAVMRPSAIRSYCRPARFLDGRPTSSCRPIRCGSETIQVASADWCEMEWIRLWRACSCTQPERSPKTPTVSIERGVRRRRSSSDGSRRCQRPRGDSVSTSCSRSHSTARASWRSTCSAPMRASRSNWTVPNTSRTPWRTAGIDARTSSFRRTTTSFFAFWQKTSGRNSTWCSTPCCVRSAAGHNPARWRVP